MGQTIWEIPAERLASSPESAVVLGQNMARINRDNRVMRRFTATHLAVALIILFAGVSSQLNATSESASAITQDCECTLVGKFHVDQRHFCPTRFRAETIELYLTALEEGDGLTSTSALNLAEKLAVNYDAYWIIQEAFGITPAGLSAILSMVGCNKEALEYFKDSLEQSRSVQRGDRASWSGKLGVAAHMLKLYEEAQHAFDQAVRLEKDYFATKPIQKRIAEASRAGQPLQP